MPISIIMSVVLFTLLMKIKFISDNSESVSFILISTLLSIIIYRTYKAIIENFNIANKNYFYSIKIHKGLKLFIVLFGFLINSILVSYFPHNTKNQQLIEKEEMHSNIWMSIVKESITAPIIEEICFRGILFLIALLVSSYILKNVKQKYNWIWIGGYLIISSISFGFAHVIFSHDYKNVGVYLVSGTIFTIVFLVTRDLKAPIFLHAMSNVAPILYRYDLQFLNEMLIVIISLYLFFYWLFNLIKIEKLSSE